MTQTSFMHGYALLVGVGADLPMTVTDATALRDVLVDPACAAYPLQQVHLLTEQQATRDAILTKFDRLIEQVKADSEATVIVYFSGHGIQVKQVGRAYEYFLIPYGYQPQRRAATALSGVEFTHKIEAMQVRKLVVFLDCCHAGGVPTLKDTEESIEKAPLPPSLLQALGTGSGRVIVASSLSNEVSWTGHPYSIFTACLLDALAGKGTREQDGIARILDILIYLIDQVPKRSSDRQHPFVNQVLNLNGNFPLCYYALRASSKTPPTSLTHAQRGRLEDKKKRLLAERVLLEEQIRQLGQAIIFNYDVLIRSKYEWDNSKKQEDLAKLDLELEDIERRLQ